MGKLLPFGHVGRGEKIPSIDTETLVGSELNNDGSTYFLASLMKLQLELNEIAINGSAEERIIYHALSTTCYTVVNFAFKPHEAITFLAVDDAFTAGTAESEVQGYMEQLRSEKGKSPEEVERDAAILEKIEAGRDQLRSEILNFFKNALQEQLRDAASKARNTGRSGGGGHMPGSFAA